MSRFSIRGRKAYFAEAEDIFVPASPEEVQRRRDSDPEIKKEIEQQKKREAEREAERQRIEAERSVDPFKYDHTDLAKKARACALCGGRIAGKERFLKIYYRGPYGQNHKAICKNCAREAARVLNEPEAQVTQ